MRVQMLVLALLTALPGCTQIQPIERAGEVQLVMAEAPAARRAIAYRMAESERASAPPNFTVLRGAACELGRQRATRTSSFRIIEQEFANVFQDEMRRAGYNTTDAISPGTPPDPRAAAAEFHLIAERSSIRANVCLPGADQGELYDGKGEASMTVQWQLVSAAHKNAVYKKAHLGHARIESIVPAVPRELLRAAFARSVHSLLADEEFRAAMRLH